MTQSRASRLAVFLISGSSALALAHGVASAADAPKSDEIVVTANRSGAESLQHVAMAISAINTDRLDKAGANSFTDLAHLTPSLNITEGAPGFNKFDMRGLTTGAYRTSDTSDSSLVAIYLDDTPISIQGQTPDLKVYDLERVEVLRGPQGTLYGAGSMAGTIRFITAKPSTTSNFGTFEATGSGTQHGSASYSVRGMINIPLINDQLGVRATVYNGQDGGFIDNIGLRNKKDANLNRTIQARVAARWTPSAKLTIDASYTYERSHADGLNSVFSGLNPYTISTNAPEGTRDDFNLYNVTGKYDLGFATLESNTSYTWRRIAYRNSSEPTIGYFFQDYTGLTPSATTYPLFKQPAAYDQTIANSIPAENYMITNKVHDFMQEVRLVSKGDGPVKWSVGGFYEHQRRNLYQDIPVAGFDTTSYENYFYGPFNTPDGKYNSKTVDAAFNANDIFSGLQNQTTRQVAIFGDATWHATGKIDLTAGLRYYNFNEKYYLFEGGTYGVVDHVPLTQNATLTAHGFNPKFNVAYHVNDDITLYAEAAKGFRAPGANQPVPIGTTGIAKTCRDNLASYGYTSAPPSFGPDHLWSYSVGEKAKLANGRVTLNADAYWIDWSDVQTRLLLNCSYFFTDNKGKIRSKGVEVESSFRPTRELTLGANLTYNDSKANGNIPTVGAFDGNLSPYAPRWIVGVAAYYDHPMGDGNALHVQVSYQHRSQMQTTFDPLATKIVGGVLTPNGPSATFAIIPASNNLDMAIAYDMGRYEFGVFGKNLTDGVKITDIGRATYFKIYQAGDRETAARPRTIGGRFKVKF